jgi:hypothetical protein
MVTARSFKIPQFASQKNFQFVIADSRFSSSMLSNYRKDQASKQTEDKVSTHEIDKTSLCQKASYELMCVVKHTTNDSLVSLRAKVRNPRMVKRQPSSVPAAALYHLLNASWKNLGT